jgi:hypothetical protein
MSGYQPTHRYSLPHVTPPVKIQYIVAVNSRRNPRSSPATIWHIRDSRCHFCPMQRSIAHTAQRSSHLSSLTIARAPSRSDCTSWAHYTYRLPKTALSVPDIVQNSTPNGANDHHGVQCRMTKNYRDNSNNPQQIPPRIQHSAKIPQRRKKNRTTDTPR